MRGAGNALPILVRLIPAALIVLAGLVAYANSLSGVFILDDKGEIVASQDIRGFFPVSRWMNDPRPVVKLSWVLNYALGGLNVGGYHAVNLAVHILAGLCLFGVVRRTLLRIGWTYDEARWCGLVIALIWVVHPLNTQSVTYVVQRAESMMGLFYLITMYAFIWGVDGRRVWMIVAVGACALGMATKAVMVTAPVVVLLYDRVFVAKSFREALKMRGFFYLALGATWGVLAGLGVLQGVVAGHGGPVTVGFGTSGVTAWEYLLTQMGVILHYLRLFLWPTPLCLDYPWPLAKSLREVWVAGVVVLAMLGVTGYLLFGRPAVGFLCATFFIALAPTSSFVPVKDVIFEHRMYLSSAALAALLVIGGRKLLMNRVGAGVQAGIAAVAIATLAAATLARNRDYQSEVGMWRDVVRQYPGNSRAQSSLGVALAVEGRIEEATAAYRAAIVADADNVEARGNLGKALSKQERYAEAIEHFERALAKDPSDVAFRNSYAIALGQVGRHDEEIAQYREVIRLDRDHVMAHFNLATALAAQNQVEEAIAEYREVIRIAPGDLEARKNMEELLVRSGKAGRP